MPLPAPHPEHPPYDGKPCPCCPIEIRDLYAIAYNITHGSGITPDKFKDLRNAVERAEPLIEAHFANTMHSHGRVA